MYSHDEVFVIMYNLFDTRTFYLFWLKEVL